MWTKDTFVPSPKKKSRHDLVFLRILCRLPLSTSQSTKLILCFRNGDMIGVPYFGDLIIIEPKINRNFSPQGLWITPNI